MGAGDPARAGESRVGSAISGSRSPLSTALQADTRDNIVKSDVFIHINAQCSGKRTTNAQ